MSVTVGVGWVFYLISSSHFVLQDRSLQLDRIRLSSASQDCSGTSQDLGNEKICHYTQKCNYKNNFLHIDGQVMSYAW